MSVNKKLIDDLKKEVRVLSRQINLLEDKNRKLRKDLIHDELTGLKTRRYLKEEAIENISAMDIKDKDKEKREEGFHHLSFLFCDIDHFKKINDTYGHDFGDKILIGIAKILLKQVRNIDIVARWGGEEFIIKLLGVDEKLAIKKAEKIRLEVKKEIAKKYAYNSKYAGLKVTLSIGIASYKKGLDFADMIKQSDEALYLAKKRGRDRVKTYSQVKSLHK